MPAPSQTYIWRASYSFNISTTNSDQWMVFEAAEWTNEAQSKPTENEVKELLEMPKVIKTYENSKEAHTAALDITGRLAADNLRPSSPEGWEQLTKDIMKLAAFTKKCGKMSEKLKKLTRDKPSE